MIQAQPVYDAPLEEMIVQAQQGDAAVQNHLLKSYQPFIAKCVSEVCKRYIDQRVDDEFSIGLSAFHEAIMCYSCEKGSSFLSFSKLVVKRKVIDYIRFVQKTPVVSSLDESYDGEQMDNPMELAAVRKKYQDEQEAWYRRVEILDFKEKLLQYKITLTELTEISPKHQDARESAISVAKILYNDEQLRKYVEQKRKLPIRDLVKKVEVSKKTLERNRKYILAIFIVLSGDYMYLKEYLHLSKT